VAAGRIAKQTVKAMAMGRPATCEQIRQTDVMEQYLLGRLEPTARDEFDEHLFECDACFDRLQTLRALRRELAATADAHRIEPARVDRSWIWNWRWALAPIAVALMIAVGVAVGQRAIPSSALTTRPSTDQPAGAAGGSLPPQASAAVASLAELGRFQPPTFVPSSLRGIQGDATARFQEAMKNYVQRDYRGAIPGLRAAVRLDPEAAHATFFLGISYLLTGQLEEGIRALRQTIDLGDSPYLEEAHLYLARAFLQNNDPIRARQQIERTIQLRGPLEDEARRLLAALDRLPPRQP
jgi:tetratricopeptide (TPR) repeat protein